MPIQSTLQLLEQTLLEATLISTGDLKRGGDRIFAMIDSARNKLSPVTERRSAPDLQVAAVSAQQELVCQLVLTIQPGNPLPEPAAYRYVTNLGKTIPHGRLKWLLRRTRDRIRREIERQEQVYRFLLRTGRAVPSEGLYELVHEAHVRAANTQFDVAAE